MDNDYQKDHDPPEHEQSDKPEQPDQSGQAKGKVKKNKRNIKPRSKKPAATARSQAKETLLEPPDMAPESAEMQDTDVSLTASTPVRARTFRLKHMVMARVLAEFTALSIMVLLPLLLLIFGHLFAFSAVVKLVFAAVALVAACILPIYGFITFQVRLTDGALTAYSLFKRISCPLDQITNLSRRSSFNWVRYVVSFDGGEFSFPVWLKDCDDLVAIVRQNLPAYLGRGGVERSIGRTFVQDPVTACVQVGQVVVSLIFIGVVWVFTLSAFTGTKAATVSGQSDFAMLVTFAAAASAVLIYRAYVVILMPTAVKLSQDKVEISTYFYKKAVALEQVKAVHAPLPLLPEGFVIKTTGGSYLVGTGMDSADELEKALRELVPERLS